MPAPPTRCRFAPSPNGALHLGHAYSALRNQAVAAIAGGVVLLRMDNIDQVRCTPANETAICEDLCWLGFSWSEPVRRQSEHVGLYAEALDRLAARGLLYPCFCSRGDIARALDGRTGWPRDPDGSPLYPGLCRMLGPAERDRRRAESRAFCLRLDMERALAGLPGPLAWTEYREAAEAVRVSAYPVTWGDAVLRRKDTPASYHIAVVVDDAAQRITNVVRGDDLFGATALHRLLQTLLGLPEPVYHHHRLILDAAGRKLSKSRHAPPLERLRRDGTTPDGLRQLLGFGPTGSA